jgi:hypothetical protein
MNLQDKAPWYSFKSLDRFNHRVGRYHKALVKHCELDIRISLDMGKSKRMSSLVLDRSSLQDNQYRMLSPNCLNSIQQCKQLEHFNKGICN